MPDAEEIQSISVSLGEMKFQSEDPEDFAEVIAIHNRVLSEKEALENDDNNSYDSFSETLEITYTLGRNRTLTRKYLLYPHSNHDPSDEIIEMTKNYLRQEKHPHQQLQKLRQETTRVLFWTKSSRQIVLSTLQIQELFALMEEDLDSGNIDSLFVFDGFDTYAGSGWRVRFELPSTSSYNLYIPRQASATYAFLTAIAVETSP